MKMLFDLFDIGKDGFIDYLEWSGRLTLKEMCEAIPEGETSQLVHKLVTQLAGQYGVDLLGPEEQELTQNLVRRPYISFSQTPEPQDPASPNSWPAQILL